MHTLTLMRHAKSSWDDPQIGDHERLLSGRGKKAAYTMACRMKKSGYTPDFVLTSSARRAVETAQRMFECFGNPVPHFSTPLLYESGVRDYLDVIREIDDRYGHLLVIAHNPTIESLAELMGSPLRKMSTAAYVRFAVPVSWSELTLKSFPVLASDFPKSS